VKTLTTKRVLRRLKREFGPEKPTLWIGKNGVTSDLIQEAQRQLESREIVKARLQRTVPQSTREIARVLATETGGEIVDIRGGSFILYKPPRREWETREKPRSEES
jgi:RNA-binding protein